MSDGGPDKFRAIRDHDNSVQSERRAMPGVRIEKKEIENVRALNMFEARRTF